MVARIPRLYSALNFFVSVFLIVTVDPKYLKFATFYLLQTGDLNTYVYRDGVTC